MSKSKNKFSAESIGKSEAKGSKQAFYFGKENYKFMLIGLAFIVVGFLLMLGPNANTVNGTFDPTSWNEDIFSIRRIRIAPLMVVLGFGIEVYAILKRNTP